MSYRLRPFLVNDRFGDPALFIGFRHEKRALLIDIGDIAALPNASLRQVTDVFVSHAHLDHVVGFDRLLRVMLTQSMLVRIHGPGGTIRHIGHKLAGYSWNLADDESPDLVFSVTDVLDERHAETCAFRFQRKFKPEPIVARALAGGVLLDDHDVRVSTAVLDHRIPCLGFAIEEVRRLHVLTSKLSELGLVPGTWLNQMKRAIRERRPADTLISTPSSEGGTAVSRSLGELRELLIREAPGRKIAYVVDTVCSDATAEKIVALARGADILFIEAGFDSSDRDLAANRFHLTTVQAGELARQAGVRKVEPFHFSLRYQGQEARLLAEVERAFRAGTKP